MPLDNLAERISKLPVLPRLLHNLMHHLGDNRIGLNKIAKLVSSDQAIAARVLRMANTAAYRGVREITTIEDACLRLGAQMLHSTIVASHLANGFPGLTEVERENFWSHTFGVAILARSIAPSVKLDANVAFTCGMLFDLGDLVILLLADQDEHKQIRELIKQGMTKSQAQKHILKMDYCQVGVLLGTKWQFPALFTRCMAQHLTALKVESPCNEAVLIGLSLEIKTALDKAGSLLKKQISEGGKRELVVQVLNEQLSPALLQHFNLDYSKLVNIVDQTMVKQKVELEALFY